MDGKMKIRTLYPDEIEVKTQSVKKNGAVAVLYKDSRVDMNILDETFGTMGWKNEHFVVDGKTFCTISVWDDDKKEWVTKSNVGSLDSGAPGAAKVKGEISDSFKRAATVVGIGRELYTSPFIWLPSDKIDIQEYNGKFQCRTELKVSIIEYDENRRICKLEIINAKNNTPVFRWICARTPTNDNKRSLPKDQPAKAQPADPTTLPEKKPDINKPVCMVASRTVPEQKPTETLPPMAEGTSGEIGSIRMADEPGSDAIAPGDVVIPLGYAKGETISAFYQREVNRATTKGLEPDVDKIFAFFERLSAPQYMGFKTAVQAFKASIIK